jgi:hypothetical protein
MDFGDLQHPKSLLIITPARFRCLAPCANSDWGAAVGPTISCIDQQTLIHQTDDWALAAPEPAA